MIRLRGDGTQGGRESVACSSFGSGFGVSAGVIVTQDKRSGWMLVSGPDGAVPMPPCRVVDAKGRRQEARDPCREAGPQAGTPGTFRNRGRASACTAGGQTGGSAQVLEYNAELGGDYIMTGREAGRRADIQYRNQHCTASQLITGRRGLSRPSDWRGGASSPSPDYFGEEGSRPAAAGCWARGQAVGCGSFWGAGFWGDMSLTPAGMAC